MNDETRQCILRMNYFFGNHGIKALVFSIYSLYPGFASFNDFSSRATPDTFMISAVIRIDPIAGR